MITIKQAGIILVSVLCSIRCEVEAVVDEHDEQCLSGETGSCNAGDAPHISQVAKNVPIIDVSSLMDPTLYASLQWNEAALEVSRACEDWGFFQVKTIAKCYWAL